MERSIVEWSIRALLMVVGTGLVTSTLRVHAASALHRAWTAAMVAMLLLPVWTKWGPSVTAPLLPAVHGRATRPEIPVGALMPRAELSQAELPQAADAEPFRSAPRSPGPHWQVILLAVYLSGIAVMLARLIRGTLQVRSMMRGVREAEGFVTSPFCTAPVAIGWLRPVLLLPDGWQTWPADKLKAVLTHEREHVRRHDPLVPWLALLNRCVFWFHPLAWWLERKLAALAEEACDTAVLGSGHAAHDYARYLIEMARSINQTGTRLRWAGAVEFSTGTLPRRIRLIMDAPPAVAVPRSKLIALASLCALMLGTVLACNMGRRSHRAPGQPTMSEQDHRDKAALLQRQQQRVQRDASAWNAALNLTPRGASELEADVETHLGDTEKLLELVRYYQSKKDLKALDALTLRFIGQHPEMRFNWGYRPGWDQVWDKDGNDRGRQLWTAQLRKTWASPFVYMNAAEFLSGNDNDQAEQALLEGRRKFPSSALHWGGVPGSPLRMGARGFDGAIAPRADGGCA